MTTACAYCLGDGGAVLWRGQGMRVVLADEPDYPGFCRVVLDAHVREMTDLPPAARRRLMDAVFATEEAVRESTGATKINLASLGNVVPHLHWHVVPRRADDPRFPDPVWGPPHRVSETPPPPRTDLARALAARLGPSS